MNKLLKNTSAIKCHKKQKILKRDDQMMQRIQTCCSKLYQDYCDFEWIIDDESYFTLGNSSINGNANFYSSNSLLTPINVKKKCFQKKY